MRIIRDLRMLNAICKKYGMIVDKKFKYITNDNDLWLKELVYKGEKYKLKYYDGCFMPFIVKVGKI